MHPRQRTLVPIAALTATGDLDRLKLFLEKGSGRRTEHQ